MSQYAHTLPDRTRVRFSLKRREGQPAYFVVFRDRTNRRLERSTRESSRKRALETAEQIIEEAYGTPPIKVITWDEAIAKIQAAMQSHNLRAGTLREYLNALRGFRKLFPEITGPAGVTREVALEYRNRRAATQPSPRTLQGNLDNLSIVWEKWFGKECRFLEENPWREVERPKLDRPDPRYLTPQEEGAFLAWLGHRWPGWRLPILFFQIKGFLGCRITELCALPAANLKDGDRLVFEAVTTKGRRTRWAFLPPELHRELRAQAGPVYVWERYSTELRDFHRTRGLRGYVRDFTPARLRRWLQHQVADYNREHRGISGFRPFSAHDFRATSMTRAWAADIPVDKASLAFGCNPDTMKKHYLHMEEEVVAREVFERLRVQSEGDLRGLTSEG